jgi:hypothetical protein
MALVLSAVRPAETLKVLEVPAVDNVRPARYPRRIGGRTTGGGRTVVSFIGVQAVPSK